MPRIWDVSALPTIEDSNPFLITGGTVISPDGKRIAACITFKIHPGNRFDSSLYAWNLSEKGEWLRQEVSAESGVMRDLNNRGEMAVSMGSNHGLVPVRVNLEGEITIIDLLPGDESGEARAITATGAIFGLSNDPAGPEGGPQAFVATGSQAEVLKLHPSSLYSAAYAVNDRGQIAGLLDVEVPNENAGEGEPAVLEKTLGFRWTPKN